MKKTLIILGAALMLASCANPQEGKQSVEQTGKLNYSQQDKWEFVAGKMQSPINIETPKLMTDPSTNPLSISYMHEIEDVEDNGHAIEAVAKGSASIDGRQFVLQQFHFHAPSEHTIDGKHSAAEVHFVHREADGRLAVIAVMLEEGAANEAFEQVLQSVDTHQTKEGVHIDDLLPEDKSYYHYLGSLTTPPLSENVEWYIMQHKMTVSADQLERFHTYYAYNNRQLQPLNDRTVLAHKA